MATKSSNRNYPALRIIATWNKLFGYIIGALILLSGFITLFGEGSNALGLGLILGAIVVVVASIAVAETIQVFLDTEGNTRSAADSLQQLVDLTEKRETPPAKNPPPKLRKKPEPAGTVSLESERGKSIKKLIVSLTDDGMSAEQIAAELNQENMPTFDDLPRWTAESVRQHMPLI